MARGVLTDTAMRTLVLFFVLAASTACLAPVSESEMTGAVDAGPATRDAGAPAPDAGPHGLYGLARPDCAPNDGPAWRLLLSETPVSCALNESEGFYVWLWTGPLETRAYPLGGSSSTSEGSACLCGALGDTVRSATVVLDGVSSSELTGRFDGVFQSGTERHDAFRVIICPAVGVCG